MSTRKLSRASRTSRTSKKSGGRSSIGSATSIVKVETSPSYIQTKLQAIIAKEEEDLIIYSVREELMKRVMEECQNRYIERQTVKFVVHCAYKALAQIVHLGLFSHDAGKPFYLHHPAWSPDKPPEHSPPDTWAVNQVAIKKKPVSSKSSTVFDIDSKVSDISDTTPLLNVFTGITKVAKEEDSFQTPPDTSELKLLYEAPLNSKQHLGSVMEPEFEFIFTPNVSETSSVEELEVEKSKTSIFTELVAMRQHQARHSLKGYKLRGFFDEVEEPPEFDVQELAFKPNFSLTKLSALRKETKCIKASPAFTESGTEISKESNKSDKKRKKSPKK